MGIMFRDIKVRAKTDNIVFNDRIDLCIYVKEQEHVTHTAEITMKPVIEGVSVIAEYDALSVPRDTAQLLFNDLWLAGFRPSDGTGNSGHIAALERHLDDMRKIVAAKLEVKL